MRKILLQIFIFSVLFIVTFVGGKIKFPFGKIKLP